MPHDDADKPDGTSQGRAVTSVIRSPSAFVALLGEMTGLDALPSDRVVKEVDRLLTAVGPAPAVERDVLSGAFYGRLNVKMFLNADTMADLYGCAAREGVTFNYHAKKALSWAVDSSNLSGFREALDLYCPVPAVAEMLVERFGGATFADTRKALAAETVRPSKLRKAHQRQVEQDVVDSSAGCLVWALWPPRTLRRHFDTFGDESALADDFLEGLRDRDPTLFERHRSLVIRRVEAAALGDGYEPLRAELTSWVQDEYQDLDNYGHLALIIEANGAPCDRSWELAADITLHAERFDQYELDRGYFRPRQVESDTVAHIPTLDLKRAAFDIAFEGFTYRDLFVMHDHDGNVVRTLLLLQKNRRDETLIPCPACRSTRVAGNSYPSFGVKSWECRNPLCPERSIYNRGKRYSFKALITQEAIENPANQIPVDSVRKWRRDVLPDPGVRGAIDMLVRHYSMENDVVILADIDEDTESHGRLVKHESPLPRSNSDDFWTSPFFERYALLPCEHSRAADPSGIDQFETWKIVEGDSAEVLTRLADDSIDRAITSPPYFNAREYSQWPNIYCYLWDMRLIHEQLFRILKPGALYAFNVFDYFDNERNITFSAMGQKRLSLSALFVDLFRRIGFEVAGNLVWDKGDVEGKRSYNAGNFSPFYQSPLNCWEHVLLFRKPGATRPPAEEVRSGQVLPIAPVKKMVRGENRHGHTAPFPEELPRRLLTGLPAGSLVLDPFGGSGSTARAAISVGCRCLLVERDPNYCKLAQTMTAEFEQSLNGGREDRRLHAP